MNRARQLDSGWDGSPKREGGLGSPEILVNRNGASRNL
jgi:hypothetical protein